MRREVTVSAWGTSMAVRIPRKALDDIGFDEDSDKKLVLNSENGHITLTKKRSRLAEMFKGYENVEYPFERNPKGGRVGRELY